MRIIPLCLIGALLSQSSRSRLKQWRRKAIVKRPPPLSNGRQIPTMPIRSLPGSKRVLMRSVERIAHGAQLEEAIRAARGGSSREALAPDDAAGGASIKRSSSVEPFAPTRDFNSPRRDVHDNFEPTAV